MAIVQIICYVVYIEYMGFCSNYVNKDLSNIGGDRANVRNEFMYQLDTNVNYCRDLLRMRLFAFV